VRVALLAKYEGNLSAVARELKTSRSQLYRLMERYGLSEKP
jgi:DNA-binding NtrC family response regulator